MLLLLLLVVCSVCWVWAQVARRMLILRSEGVYDGSEAVYGGNEASMMAKGVGSTADSSTASTALLLPG